MANPLISAHSALSFSGRERWATCPVSVVLSAGMPDNTSPAAAEGTAAHTVGEYYVRQREGLPGAQEGDAPTQAPVAGLARFEGLSGDALAAEIEKWNGELRHHGLAYAAFVHALAERHRGDGEAFVSLETKVAAATIHPDLYGTSDCLVWCPQTATLVVVDYKYGFMPVDIGTLGAPNKQIAAYAVAAMDQCTLAAKRIVLAVFQPRLPLGDTGQLLELPGEWIAAERTKLALEATRVDQARAGDTTLSTPVPGDHCRYCKGKSKCSAIVDTATAAIQAHSGARSVLDIPEDELIAIFAARTAFKAFLDDIEERVTQLATVGHRRLTVDEKQGRKMWRDPATAAVTLLALGRTDLLEPVALSKAIEAIPADYHDELVTRSRPSRSIRVLQVEELPNVAQVFAKFAKNS